MAHKIRFATAPDIGSQELTEEIIRKRAYQLFELHGCQHGHDMEHWLEAEAEVTGRKSGTSADAEKYATQRDSAA
jgi:Protein of unknown function (DUF2934)